MVGSAPIARHVVYTGGVEVGGRMGAYVGGIGHGPAHGPGPEHGHGVLRSVLRMAVAVTRGRVGCVRCVFVIGDSDGLGPEHRRSVASTCGWRPVSVPGSVHVRCLCGRGERDGRCQCDRTDRGACGAGKGAQVLSRGSSGGLCRRDGASWRRGASDLGRDEMTTQNLGWLQVKVPAAVQALAFFGLSRAIWSRYPSNVNDRDARVD